METLGNPTWGAYKMERYFVNGDKVVIEPADATPLRLVRPTRSHSTFVELISRD